MVDPDVGLVTNVGPAHLENLGSLDGVARAKGELFLAMREEAVAVVNGDDPRVAAYRNLRERTLRGENIFIAEAALIVRRLIESDYKVESIFCTKDHAEEFEGVAGEKTPVRPAFVIRQEPLEILDPDPSFV